MNSGRCRVAVNNNRKSSQKFIRGNLPKIANGKIKSKCVYKTMIAML